MRSTCRTQDSGDGCETHQDTRARTVEWLAAQRQPAVVRLRLLMNATASRSDDTASGRGLKSHQTIAPTGWQHGRCLHHALGVVPERLVKHRGLPDGSIDEVRQRTVGVVHGRHVNLDARLPASASRERRSINRLVRRSLSPRRSDESRDHSGFNRLACAAVIFMAKITDQ